MRQNLSFAFHFLQKFFWEKITSGNGGSLKIVKRRFCVTKIRSFGGVLYESNLEQNVNLSKNLSPLGRGGLWPKFGEKMHICSE